MEGQAAAARIGVEVVGDLLAEGDTWLLLPHLRGKLGCPHTRPWPTAACEPARQRSGEQREGSSQEEGDAERRAEAQREREAEAEGEVLMVVTGKGLHSE